MKQQTEADIIEMSALFDAINDSIRINAMRERVAIIDKMIANRSFSVVPEYRLIAMRRLLVLDIRRIAMSMADNEVKKQYLPYARNSKTKPMSKREMLISRLVESCEDLEF